MTYVIQEPCVGVKDAACVDVCPVDCIYETEPTADTNMLPMFIHNEECIDCGACEPECPVEAIYEDEEEAIENGEREYVKRNYEFFDINLPSAYE